MAQQSHRIFRLFMGGGTSPRSPLWETLLFLLTIETKYSFVTRTNTLLVVIIIIIHMNLYRMLQKATFKILKFCMIESLGGLKRKKWINIFIHFLCLCPLRSRPHESGYAETAYTNSVWCIQSGLTCPHEYASVIYRKYLFHF